MPRKKLPIGIQTFREIREGGYYYVDKTPFALRLIDDGKYYVLSRPRRFGKSLLVDTLKELFEGNHALFEGLYAEHHWDWSVKYPVVRLRFGGGRLRTPEDLAANLHDQLSALEQEHGVPQIYPGPSSRFHHLIATLHQRTGRRVVALVDGYDQPILDHIADPVRARAMRDRLFDVYSVLKEADAHLHFVFLTGVTKFSTGTVFSGINHLYDITLHRAYSAICGFTDADIDSVFAAELDGLDRDQIRAYFHGYGWCGTTVSNPCALLRLFRERAFRPYWFESGDSSYVVNLLVERRFFTPDLARLETSSAILSAFHVDQVVPEAALWQMGCLTIREEREVVTGIWVYTLGYPNREVEIALNAALLPALFRVPGAAVPAGRRPS